MAKAGLLHGLLFGRAPLDRRREARLLARHLLGTPIRSELVERYVEAHDRVVGGDDAVSEFAVAHPVLLPHLDAASALIGPNERLRKKLLLMAAILEASPDHADRFLKEPPSARRLAGTLVRAGLSTLVKVPIGAALLGLLHGPLRKR